MPATSAANDPRQPSSPIRRTQRTRPPAVIGAVSGTASGTAVGVALGSRERPPIMLKHKRLLNLLTLERFLIDLMIPSGRKTR
jgi:hypothetical protein